MAKRGVNVDEMLLRTLKLLRVLSSPYVCLCVHACACACVHMCICACDVHVRVGRVRLAARQINVLTARISLDTTR